FEIAKASDIDPESANKALKNKNESASAGWTQTRWVGAVASFDSNRNQEILFSSLQGGPDWPLLPELYVPLTQVKDQILAKARPLRELSALNRSDDNVKMLAEWKDEEVKWLPLRGKLRNMVVLIDSRSAEVIKIIDLDPWAVSAGNA
ncbi:MAG: hypothetical protein ACU83V_13940, partial [Gammaproteobacteria bacterium]